MKITWLGHSCFKIEKNGYTVILDPYEDGRVPGYSPIRESADLVLCSHEHGDHNARQVVTLKQGGECPFVVEKIETFHDDAKGTLRGPNTVHILNDGSCKIAHMGDLGCELTDQQMEQLKGLEVLMVPVGGHYTIDAAQAAKLTKQLQPRIVLPMHYRGGSFGYDVIGPVEDFIQQIGEAEATESSVLDTEKTYTAQLVLLDPQNKA